MDEQQLITSISETQLGLPNSENEIRSVLELADSHLLKLDALTQYATVNGGRAPPPGGGGGRLAPAPSFAEVSAPRRQKQACDLSLGLLLFDLDKAEQLAYSKTFASLRPDARGLVPAASAELRECLLGNCSGLSAGVLDAELVAAAEPLGGINEHAFLRLLRHHCVSEANSRELFQEVKAFAEEDADLGPEILRTEECQHGLRLFTNRHLGPMALATFSQYEQQRIFKVVLQDAGATVKLQEWIGFCRMISRIVRLVRYEAPSSCDVDYSEDVSWAEEEGFEEDEENSSEFEQLSIGSRRRVEEDWEAQEEVCDVGLGHDPHG